MSPTGRAVVMGSAQKPEEFDRERLEHDGVALVARRSGGGAVYIDPASTVWVDVLAPRSSPLWHDDLTATFLGVGRAWQRALTTCGIVTELCVEPTARTEAVRHACWAGLGWGELSSGGSKVVGLSQRRTRWGARVQAMAVLDGSAVRVADYLLEPAAAVVRAELVPSRPSLFAETAANSTLVDRLTAEVVAELS